jgi:hypothetical protein
MKRWHLALGLMVICGAGFAQAQAMKPGLWEINSKVSGNPEMDKAMAEMQKQLAAMPPAQRKQMEQMLAQQGVQFGIGAAGGTVAKMCFSKKMADEFDVRVDAKDDCVYTRQPRLGNSMKFSFSCEGGKTTGQGEYRLVGDAGWDGDVSVTSTEKGKKQTMNVKSTGKWLGANCGDLKPFDETPAGKAAKK